MEYTQETQIIIDNSQLTSGRTIAKSTVLNFIGLVLPLTVALAAVPILIKGLGLERFGILNLIWLIIGYFSLFDFGLGRAITQLVANLLGQKRINDIPGYVWTALSLMLILGVVGSFVVILLTPLLVQRILKIPTELQAETVNAFYLLAICIPVVISTVGLRGILEAQQRWDLVNYVRIPLGLFLILGPLFMLPFTNDLFYIVAVLALTRLIAWIVSLILVINTMPILRRKIALQRSALLPLLRFGGWMTISSIVGPIMVNMDRFLIGAFISAAAVAYYATPYEAVNKITLIPSALVGVLFPAFAVSYIQDQNRAVTLLDRGIRVVFLVLFPLILLIVGLSEEGMRLWLGQAFADKSARVLQILAIGVLANNLALVPFTFVQGIGRPDITAKLHLIELPFYLLLLWQLMTAYGIVGAAIAWTARNMLDMILLLITTSRLIRLEVAVIRRTALLIGIGLLVLWLEFYPLDINLRLVLLLFALVTFAVVAWLILLSPSERTLAMSKLKLLQKHS